MSVLSDGIRDQVEQHLVAEKILTSDQLRDYKQKATDQKMPLFPLLLREEVLTNEQLTRAIATVTNSPYVNLQTANINFDVLTLLPKDIAERYMAVPLGEIHHRLVVAMLDADNVQAVDFLSKKVGRPLKVFTASEEGIRRVLSQYERKLDRRAIND